MTATRIAKAAMKIRLIHHSDEPALRELLDKGVEVVAGGVVDASVAPGVDACAVVTDVGVFVVGSVAVVVIAPPVGF
jgi:hypothetical protein